MPNYEKMPKEKSKNLFSAFDMYVKNILILNPPVLTIEEEARLANCIKSGTFYANLPSRRGIRVKKISCNHVEIYSPFPKLVDAAREVAYEMKRRGILNSKIHLQEDSKLNFRLKEGYSIELYYGKVKIRMRCRTPDAEKAKQELVYKNLRLVISILTDFAKGKKLTKKIEELLQEANCFLIEKVDYYDPGKIKFSTFFGKSLIRFLYNLALNHGSKKEGFSDKEIYGSQFLWQGYSAEASENLEKLHRAIDLLGDREKAAIFGAYWEGKSHKQIGEYLRRANGEKGLTKEGVRQLEKKALGELAVLLNS